MSVELVLAHALLPSAVSAAAAFGAWRCWRLLRYARDPRLLKLMWFYGLFAASLVPMVIWTAQLPAAVGDALPSGSLTQGSPNLHGEFAAAEGADWLLLVHHVLMLASLGVAVQAFGHKRAGAAVPAAALAALAPFLWVALAAEAGLTLYLAVLAILNRAKRRSPGALQVAMGFFLFFLGHLSFFLLYHPAGVRTPLGDVLSLVGIVLLVQLLPRPSA